MTGTNLELLSQCLGNGQWNPTLYNFHLEWILHTTET